MAVADEETTERTSGVIRWRRRVLLEAGYPAKAARELADRLDIDLHTATYLLQSGCDLATALKILR